MGVIIGWCDTAVSVYIAGARSRKKCLHASVHVRIATPGYVSPHMATFSRLSKLDNQVEFAIRDQLK